MQTIMFPLKRCVPALVFLLLLSGCVRPNPTITPTEFPPAAPPPAADTPGSSTPLTERIRIRLLTTSDWTDLTLISGALLLTHELIAADEQAGTAVVSGDQLILDQPIGRAEAGEDVELVVEMLLSAGESGGPVTFNLARGDIGTTWVEISRPVGQDWVVVYSISWDGILGDGSNLYRIQIPVQALFGELPGSAEPSQAAAASPVAPVSGLPQGTDGYPWWNDTVFYEIYVRSFYDSDGDGTGDLNGVTQKLDYLNDGDPGTTSDLGVTGIWLMPIFPSHTLHGYNATDYYAVNPDYGTLADLENLLAEAHARGMRVILDLTLNQTSNQHPWFVQGLDPASPYHDWYVWSETDPGYPGSWGQQVWFPANGRYYYSAFSAWSPDLNHTNPAVKAEMFNVTRFWLEQVGVDGFRLDAAKHLIEEGTQQVNTVSTHTWWQEYRAFYKQINPQAFTVAEIWEETAITAEYLQGDEFDSAFEFYLAAYFLFSANAGTNADVNFQIQVSDALIPPQGYAPFLTNHDQDRVMTQLADDPNKARVAASLLLTAPGVPFLYYGEEVGMQGEVVEDLNRRPMQWSADPFAGFSGTTPWKALGPGWQSMNVASETDDPESLLTHYRALIQARSQHAALRVGELSVVETGNDALYAILRQSQEEAVLVLVNLGGTPLWDYQLSLGASMLQAGDYSPLAVLGEGPFALLSVLPGGAFTQYVPVPVIPPYATLILQLPPPLP